MIINFFLEVNEKLGEKGLTPEELIQSVSAQLDAILSDGERPEDEQKASILEADFSGISGIDEIHLPRKSQWFPHSGSFEERTSSRVSV